MACDSCKTVVGDELRKLRATYSKVDSGEADGIGTMTGLQNEKLHRGLKALY